MARKKKALNQEKYNEIMKYVAKRDEQRRLVIRLCNELPAEKSEDLNGNGALFFFRDLLSSLGLDAVDVARRFYVLPTMREQYEIYYEIEALKKYEESARRCLLLLD